MRRASRKGGGAGGRLPGHDVFSGLSTFTAYTLLYHSIDGTPYIYAGGDRGTFDRINVSDGSSTSFIPSVFGSVTNRIIYDLQEELAPAAGGGEPQPDGLILVGGKFFTTTNANGTTTQEANLVRVDGNGIVDTTYNVGNGANDAIVAILPLPDGTSIIGGEFTKYQAENRNHIAKVTNTGAIDDSFNNSLSIDDKVLALASQIDTTTHLPNGQILVAGTFNSVGKTSQPKLVRLNADGTVDTTFRPKFDTRVLALAVQGDGKIVVGGEFSTVNGVAHRNLARLNQDGSLDTTFTANFSGNLNNNFPPTAVYRIKLLPLGQMLVGGNFLKANGTSEQFLARLGADGTVDLSFNSGTTILNSVQDLLVQPDDNIVVAETFSKKINGTAPDEVIRLFAGAALAPASVVISALNPATTEKIHHHTGRPTNASIVITRSGGNLTAPLTVFYAVSGSAAAGQDYKALSGEAVIPANETSIRVRVRPTGDVLSAPVTVTLTLLGSIDQEYDLTGQTEATVTIAPK